MIVRSLAVAIGLLVCMPASAFGDWVPTHQDGSGGIPVLPEVPVTTFRISDLELGVRTYTEFGSGGARFGGSGERGIGEPRKENDGQQEAQDDKDSKEDCPKSGNPIVIASGNKIEPELDFAAAGEMGLHLKRTWNQHWDGIGLFGYHWLSTFDVKLSFGSSYGISACYPRPSIAECQNGHTYTTI